MLSRAAEVPARAAGAADIPENDFRVNRFRAARGDVRPGEVAACPPAAPHAARVVLRRMDYGEPD
jgi:hypothetical protein